MKKVFDVMRERGKKKNLRSQSTMSWCELPNAFKQSMENQHSVDFGPPPVLDEIKYIAMAIGV